MEFGPDDRAHVDAFLELTLATDAVDCPWEPPRTRFRQEMSMRHGWEGEPGRWFVAYDEGTPVGTAVVDASDYDNLEMAWLTMRIAPAYRRRGLGSALMDALEAVTTDMGRPLVGADGWDSEAVVKFAAAHGYDQKAVAVRRVQEVATAPDPRPIRDEALAHAQDYELVRIEGYAPDELLPELADLTAVINDAPFDDLEWEEEVFSPERVRAYEHAQIESGHRFRRLLARHRPTGELAGHTVVVVDSESPNVAEQHDTSVARAHRGHRLGLLLKTEMLLWLAETEPQVTHVHTDNAESNRHMGAVNERLGYRVVGRSLEFQRRTR